MNRTHRTATLFQTNVTFRQRRQLPPQANGTVIVGPGQELSMVQVVARIEGPSELAVVPAAADLGVPPADILKYLLVQRGSEVRPGQPLGEKKGRLGRKKIVTATTEGQIIAVEDGSIFIRQKPKGINVRSLVKGWVAYSVPERGVAIETKGSRLEAACGSTQEGFGEVMVLTTEPSARVEMDLLSNQIQGKIAIVGHLDLEKWVAEAANRGAHGVIAGSISGEIFMRLNQLDIPVFVTDGVGRLGMSSLFFDTLNRYDGRECGLLAAATSHSARPLIVLPDQAPDSTIVTTNRPELQRGSRVRLLQNDRSGFIGEVQKLYPGRRTEVGQRPICQADVRLDNGDVITVLCRNLDIIM